jgi:hypothetical protein
MTKEELEKEADTPCTKCIFKGKCPSENEEEVYKICKEIGGQKMTKEELKQEAEENSKIVYGYINDAYGLGHIESAEPREKRIAELEKENVELKGIKNVATLIRANNDTVITLMQLNNKLVSKEHQLTKAKELLTRFVMASVYFNGKEKDLVEEVEQFLKE